VRFIIDKEKAALHGISAETISETLRVAVGGESVDLLHIPREKEDVNIVFQLPLASRTSPEELLALRVRSGDANALPEPGSANTAAPLVPLRELVTVEYTITDKSIYHKNLMPVTYVIGDVAGSIESPVYAILKMNQALRRLDVSEGRVIRVPDSTKSQSENGDSQSSSLRNTIHDGGTYVNMEGPAFSTRAESLTNHRLGYDVIGMTNLGEAKCAREAEIAYATLAMSTDYDCWKEDEHVTLAMIIQNLQRNADMAKKIVASAISRIPAKPGWPCHDALKHAILTDKKLWPKKTVTELKPILAKYL
jgi:hypothetical protein